MTRKPTLHEDNHVSKFPVPDSEAATSLTKLYLLARHSDIGESAAGPAGGVGAFS